MSVVDTPPGQPSYRMAPGVAKTFQPPPGLELEGAGGKPWIALSGDEASKAWVLKATAEPWVYETEVLLDIDAHYGENTTQTVLKDPFGVTISTVGEIGIQEDPDSVTLYVPVFEATHIHVFRSKEPPVDLDDSAAVVPSMKAGWTTWVIMLCVIWMVTFGF